LNQLQSTSIAGNDITSSIFYTIGVATLSAGKLTPISISLVFLVLYLFRSIYSEVCTALPLNGGTYNALLNTTSK
jgi:amino acid transporter